MPPCILYSCYHASLGTSKATTFCKWLLLVSLVFASPPSSYPYKVQATALNGELRISVTSDLRHLNICNFKIQRRVPIPTFWHVPFLHLFSSSSRCWITFFRLLFLSFSFSYFFFHSSAVSSRFTETVFLIVFALRNKTRCQLFCNFYLNTTARIQTFFPNTKGNH